MSRDAPQPTNTPAHDDPVSGMFDPALDVLSLLPWPVRGPTGPVRFRDPRWDLSAVSTWPAYASPRAIVWSSIDDPHLRTTAKEAAILLMCPQIGLEHHLPLARRRPYPAWALPYQRISYWRRWFAYLTEEGVTHLSAVTQDMCDGFLTTITPECRHIAISAMRVFADYEPLLSFGGYSPRFRPWGTQSAAGASGQPGLGSASNKTPPIPDRVLGPLLAACLHLVEQVSADVEAAQAHLANLRAIESPRGGRRPDFDARLDAYLSALALRGQPLPAGPKGTVNLSMVALHLGMRDPTHLDLPDRRAKIMAAAKVAGTSGGGLLGARAGIEYDLRSLTRATQVVRTACLVVVAALSGMRHSELAAIAPGAIRREETTAGQVRYRVASTLLKGEPPGGKREHWTVIEPVATALAVAEKVTAGPRPLQVAAFAPQYDRLRAWVNEHAEAEGLERIPPDWQLEPRQFRRTLAREIAWRPGGVIAGKIHLKHISVATTEGYAGKRGESASAFLAEIEAEQRAHNRQTTEEVLRAIQRGEPVAALGAAALTTAVASLDTNSTPQGAQVRDRDAALIALVRAQADTLHVTPLVNCWFKDPSQARCLTGVKDKSKPVVVSCQPDKCINATVHPHHAPAWVSGIDALRATIADRRVPMGERVRLTAKADEMEAVIAPFRGANP